MSRDSISIPKRITILNPHPLCPGTTQIRVSSPFFSQKIIFSWGCRDAHPLSLKIGFSSRSVLCLDDFFVPSFSHPFPTLPIPDIVYRWFASYNKLYVTYTVSKDFYEMHEILPICAHFRIICSFSCFPMNSWWF